MNPHTCCLCQKIMSSRGSLKNHIENIHRSTALKFCDLCPKFILILVVFVSICNIYDLCCQSRMQSLRKSSLVSETTHEITQAERKLFM